MKGTKSKTTQSCKQEVDAENFREVKSWFARTGVLPNFKIPIRPVPNRSEHQEAAEDDMSSCDAFETPEARIDSRFSGDTPTSPASGNAKSRHKGHDEHALAPHGVQDWIRWIKNREFVEGHRAGPAGNEGSVHEVHGQESARVVNDDGVHPIPGQSHGSGSGGTELLMQTDQAIVGGATN